MSSNSTSALVPEEEYLAGDWLEDDLGEIRPKKKRRIRMEQNGIRGEDMSSSSAARGHNRSTNSDVVSRGILGFIFVFHSQRRQITSHFCNSSLHAAGHSSSSRGHSLRKNSSMKPHQVKMTQIPGMVRLGRREVIRPQSPTTTDEDDMRPQTSPPQTHTLVRRKPLMLHTLNILTVLQQSS